MLQYYIAITNDFYYVFPYVSDAQVWPLSSNKYVLWHLFDWRNTSASSGFNDNTVWQEQFMLSEAEKWTMSSPQLLPGQGATLLMDFWDPRGRADWSTTWWYIFVIKKRKNGVITWQHSSAVAF